jgi:hypothetical protein
MKLLSGLLLFVIMLPILLMYLTEVMFVILLNLFSLNPKGGHHH